MYTNVRIQAANMRKWFVANAALIGFFMRMGPNMLCKISCEYKRFVTLNALE